MTDSEKFRRLGLDKVALFLLFVVGLFIAELIVLSRGTLKLSKPVELPGCGLAVSVPAVSERISNGNGFEYKDDEFRLACIMRISGDSAVIVHWRYFIVPFKETIAEKFQAQASDIEGDVENTGSEKIGQFTFDYAGIFSEKNETLLLSGATQLPDGRTLMLDVAQKGGGTDLAEKIFRSLAASVTFTQASPLADGRKLMSDFRQKNLEDIVQKETRQNYYYIEDYTGRNMGFIIDAVALRNSRRDANSLTAASLYCLYPVTNPSAEQSLFRSDPNLRTFKWISQQNSFVINRQVTTSIELDRQGMITVHSAGQPLPQGIVSQETTLAPTMLPEMLFDIFIESFLESSFSSVMVDLIISDGRITPALITKTQPQKTAEPNAVSAVKILYFGTDAGEQTTYFDGSGKILLSEVHGKLSYKLKRAERNRLVADFPAWLDKLQEVEQYIQGKDKKE